MTVPAGCRTVACARSPGLSSAHQRAASCLACASQEEANQTTTRCASSPYCGCGWLPLGAGSGRITPDAVSSAQSGGRTRPFPVRCRVSATAPFASWRHRGLPVSAAMPFIAVSDQ